MQSLFFVNADTQIHATCLEKGKCRIDRSNRYIPITPVNVILLINAAKSAVPEKKLENLSSLIVCMVTLGGLSSFCIVDNLYLLVPQLLELDSQLEELLTQNLVLIENPLIVSATLALVEADVMQCIRNLRNRWDDLTRVGDDRSDCLSLGGARSQLSSRKGLLAFLRFEPSFELVLVQGKAVIVATDVGRLQAWVLSSNLRTICSHGN
jgi:hypothetical protein